MADYFPEETSKKSFGFVSILVLVALMVFSMVAIRIYGMASPVPLGDPTIKPDPAWYNWLIVIFGSITWIGLFLTYKYKKIGVYTVIVCLFGMILSNPEFSLLRTLLPTFTAFIFIGFGLFEIVPKWKFFS